MKKVILIFIVLLNILFNTQKVKAQIEDPVKFKYSVNLLENNEAELIFDAKIEDKWHLYGQNFPEGGPIPLLFTFETNENYELIGKVEEFPKAHEELDEIFNINVQTFSDKVKFTQKIKILTDKPFVVKGNLDGQACVEMCVLVQKNFSFEINGSIKTTTKSETNLNTDNKKTYKETIKLNVKPQVDEDTSLWWLFILSFLAGLAAIVTPCVFPMIPMTVSFFMGGEKSKLKAKAEALFFGLSIIAIYTVIGSVIAVTLGASFANILSTHWIPNILFFVIFVVFAASFFGMFEITLPSWMVNKSDKQADKGGWLGIFFMAFTLVVVSFSCTGPIVGSIVVASANGEVLMPIIGMLGFSLAFALPFTLFAFFPSWLSSLPKSGGWLNSVKVVLGFLELALGLKFLSIADQTYHWGILDREVYLALWIVIFALMGFYLLGKLRFSHDSEVKTLSVGRLMLSIATFSFVMYMIPGMFGAPLRALSGYIPPQTSLDFDLENINRENSTRIIEKLGGGKTLCEEAKYSEKLHLPHGLHGYFDYKQGLKCAKELGKPIFIDFTGHGCVNCREMEANVWSDPQVLEKLRNDFIIITLYVDDKNIVLPESEWVKSLQDGEIKKTLGEVNADFEIYNFNKNSQPLYAILDHNGNSMTEKMRTYNKDITQFVKFLNEGMKNFSEINN